MSRSRSRSRPPLLVAMVLLLSGCPKSEGKRNDAKERASDNGTVGAKHQRDNGDGGHIDEHEHEAMPKRVKLAKNVIADANVRTVPVIREKLLLTIAIPGEIAADPDKSARVSSPVAGRIEQLSLKEGAVVKKGDPLALIRVPELGKIRSSFAATSAKATAARANAKRLQSLSEKNLAATQEVASAVAEADALEAEAHAAEEQLGALGMGSSGGGPLLTLRAPLSGIIITRDAVVGQPVTTDQAIATIANLSEVWFLGRVFEKDLGRVEIGAKSEVQLNAFAKERFDGTVEYISKQIDPVGRTLTARVRLANRDGLLRIGLFGTARVALPEEHPKPPALVVPRTAITEIGNKSVVFVRHPDDDFELHEVVTGESSLGKVEILNGLRDGEDVVVDGVFTLKSAVLKSTIAEED